MAMYIHYGAPTFDLNRFDPITNQNDLTVKPNGGLWASRVDSKYGWRTFCQEEPFWCKPHLEESFKFRLQKTAKICHLFTVEDLVCMPRRADIKYNQIYSPDYEKMVEDGWDAVELHFSDSLAKEGNNSFSLYWQLYGWDCDSIVIMNPDIIIPGN